MPVKKFKLPILFSKNIDKKIVLSLFKIEKESLFSLALELLLFLGLV